MATATKQVGMMTPEELETFVARGDCRGLVEAVKDLTEPERKKLSTTAQKLNKEIEKARWQPTDVRPRDKPLERLMAFLGRKKKVTLRDQTNAAQLAVQAFAPLSQVKKTSFVTPYGQDENLSLEIIRDRRPEWIDEWVEGAMGGEFPSLDWKGYRALQTGGCCKKPESEQYYRFFASGLLNASTRNKDSVKLGARLAAEPDLIEDIWKLFEVETDAFAYDWYSSNPDHQGWPAAILELCMKGLLDRNRLLDATLSGLTTGFKNNVLSGFAKLHEKLEPAGDELAARLPTYCDLLSANQNQVVSFAVKILKKLEQAKKLDDATFVPAVAPVFNIKTKGPPKAVVALLKKIAKRSPKLHPEIRMSLVEAVSHPAEDVQAKAVELLVAYSDGIEPDIAERLQEGLEDVAATVRPKVLEIIESAGGTVEAATEGQDVEERLAECRARAKALPAAWLDKAGVPDAIDATENATWPAPLCFDMMSVPVLTSVKPVQPIETVEELIDTVAHAVEQLATGIEVERILDGISRLCDQKPDDFDRRVAPIVKRIEKLKDSENRRSIGVEQSGITEVPRVIATWLCGDPKLTKSRWNGSDNAEAIIPFLNTRVAALRGRVGDSVASPLLAAPTHEGGWIDPRSIVDRRLEMQQASLSLPKFELIQALLRMAPDGRAEALESATEISGEKARALRWALGGKDGPKRNDTGDADIWIAAARSRGPMESFEELAILGATRGEPNTIRPAVHEWKAKVREQSGQFSDAGIVYRFEEIDVVTKPSVPKKLADSRPTALLCRRQSRHLSFTSPWVHDWVGMVWPSDMQPYFVSAAKALVSRLGENSSSWEPNHAFLPALFQVDRPWTEIATLTAILGAIGRDQDARGLAIDALIEAIADGRATSESLGSVLATLAIPQWLKLNRVAQSFAEVARISPFHSKTVLGMLEQLVVAWEEIPRDAHHVLSLIQELMAQLGIATSEVVIEKLSGMKGSSKTAKLSKAIRTFNPHSPSPDCDEARLLILESRLDRAERWAGA